MKLQQGKVYKTWVSFKYSKDFSTFVTSTSSYGIPVIFLGYENCGYWLKCLRKDKIVYYASYPTIETHFILVNQ